MDDHHRPLALIVWQDRDNREMYAAFLATAGISTAQAGDGLHGLAKATTLVPDVIAVDLRLPRLDGAEMCQRLKQQTRTRNIPVIALTTGPVAKTEVEQATDAGCAVVLVKPCLPATLLAEISRLLHLPIRNDAPPSWPLIR